MKEGILKEEKNQKTAKKVFTKKKGKDIIKKNYNPFEVNYKICKRREEVYMNIILKEIEKEFNWKRKLLLRMFPKTFIKVYGMASKKATNNILI